MISFIFLLFTILPNSYGQLNEEDSEKCQEALQDAYNSLLNTRNMQTAALASTGQINEQSNNKSPIADIMEKMSENKVKTVDLLKQRIENQQRINTEQFKQLDQIEDKKREVEREKSKAPIEIKNAEFERRKAEAGIRSKCQEVAQRQYQKVLEDAQDNVSKSNFATGSVSGLRGTRSRMKSQLKLFYARCLADPSTQESFQLAREELDSKIHNMQVQSGIFNSDIEHIKSKIPKLITEMDAQRKSADQSFDLQMNALEQANGMQQQALMFAVLTDQINAASNMSTSESFNTADDIINRWESVAASCGIGSGKPFGIPNDLVGLFRPVNTACRPKSKSDPRAGCAVANGRSSFTPTNNSNSEQ